MAQETPLWTQYYKTNPIVLLRWDISELWYSTFQAPPSECKSAFCPNSWDLFTWGPVLGDVVILFSLLDKVGLILFFFIINTWKRSFPVLTLLFKFFCMSWVEESLLRLITCRWFFWKRDCFKSSKHWEWVCNEPYFTSLIITFATMHAIITCFL